MLFILHNEARKFISRIKAKYGNSNLLFVSFAFRNELRSYVSGYSKTNEFLEIKFVD